MTGGMGQFDGMAAGAVQGAKCRIELAYWHSVAFLWLLDKWPAQFIENLGVYGHFLLSYSQKKLNI